MARTLIIRRVWLRRALNPPVHRRSAVAVSRWGIVALAACLTSSGPAAIAQQTDADPELSGDRLKGVVLPIEPRDVNIHLRALRATAWDVDDTRRLLLTGDVRIQIGQYTLQSTTAVVWINRIQSAKGPINQIAAYFERLAGSSGGAGRAAGDALEVGGRGVLLTASARGEVAMNVARLVRGPPTRAETARVRTAEAHLAAYLKRLAARPPPLKQLPQLDQVTARLPVAVAQRPTPTGAEPHPAPLFAPKGTVHFAADRIAVTTGTTENVITAIGSIVVEYVGPRGAERFSHLTLAAERAVVFTDPGPITQMLAGPIAADMIRGIYLEGNVTATADEGAYFLRSPQAYYDFRTNQAILLNAVLRTYSRKHRVPIYVRAEEMRQIAANQWSAGTSLVSTSEFFIPHFALGTQRVTITQRPAAAGADPEETAVHLESRDNTLRIVGVPILYWPKFSGTIGDLPLRGINIGSRDNDGLVIKTRWNPFSLLGIDQPSGVEAELLLDSFTKRGPAAGLDLSYASESTRGTLKLYGLHDDGVDRTSSGLDVTPSEQWRGIALWEQQTRLDKYWTLQIQSSLISDESFVTSWFENDFYTRREYQSSLYLRHRNSNAALTLLVKADLDDFISNSYLLASRQYQVQKLPELTYRRYGDSWLNDTLTYSGETRLSRVRLSFEQSTPRQLGVPAAAFGIPANQPVGDSLRARGLSESSVIRFDTRHEVAMPLNAGSLNIVPFVVGRFTAYDTDFDEFSPEADSTRVFGAAGLRLNTQFQRIDNSVENRLLDLHRLRHIVEPRLQVWYGYSNVSDGDLPVYDEGVESIGTGSVIEIGLLNTFQTQRGGPGRWRSVDVLTVDAAVVLNSGDVNREAPSPRLFAYRPEYSQFGDHVQSTMIWLLSDHLSLAAEGTYDLDSSMLARGSIGMELRHNPLLATYVEYRFLQVSDNELLEIGWNYRLTPKYRVFLSPQWDFKANDFRAVSLTVVRSFPDFDVIFRVTHDEIADVTSFGASLRLAEF
ncbi:MAG: LPS assembly protein LptD [Planctomycetes bacterium]|nr:LPS assembly protein LptD [Planctomycetota bacterium]